MKIALFGATGYVGGNILTELLDRGHAVRAAGRNTAGIAPADRLVSYTGTIADPELVEDMLDGTDAVVISLPSLGVEGKDLAAWLEPFFAAAAERGIRLGFVGAAGSLKEFEGGPSHADGPEFPDFLKPLNAAHNRLLDALKSSDERVDWFYLSPAVEFSPYDKGTRLNRYRTGSTLILRDETGRSFISGADYAIAFVDELEKPTHRRKQFTVAY